MPTFLGVNDPKLLMRAHARINNVTLPPALMAQCHCAVCGVVALQVHRPATRKPVDDRRPVSNDSKLLSIMNEPVFRQVVAALGIGQDNRPTVRFSADKT